jgi:hypothetical protein
MPVDLLDVAVACHVGPAAVEDGVAVGVVLDLGDDVDAVVFESGVEAADAAEQADRPQGFHGREASPLEDGAGWSGCSRG